MANGSSFYKEIENLISKGPHQYEIGKKQLTIAFGGVYIASTTHASKPLLVWETEKSYPRYYIPASTVHPEIRELLIDHEGQSTGLADLRLADGKHVTCDTNGGMLSEWESRTKNNYLAAIEECLNIDGKRLNWVRLFEGPLKGYIRFEKGDVDDMFEDGLLIAGIKNPYKRIDTAAVAAQIAVKVAGEVVAITRVAVLLNETNLKETYYLPATSILNWGATEKSSLRTECPYKGEARYLHLTVKGKKYENLIWYYPYPTHESAAVQGLISFYNKEGVDILLNGVKI